jgi:peptidoglycan hydrolase-like protein with peptidoglycan-binding domain
MRFNEFKVVKENVNLGPADATPGAPATKQKFVITPPTSRRGPEVADVQKALVALGYTLPKHGVDGIRGPETVAAVKKFQTDNSLAVDGDPGPDTVTKLNDILKSKPEVASTLTKSTAADVKGPVSASAIDTSAIQDPDFNSKIAKIASALGIEADDLYKIIKFETAGTFSPKSQDPNNVSIGLIGFTEKTANSLGTSKAELGNMTATEQLDYVYKFYKMVGVRPGDDRGTIYMLTFMPAFAHSSDKTVLGQKGGGTLMLPSGKSTGLSMHKVWEQNPAFTDKFKRDSFTVGDVKNKINSR